VRHFSLLIKPASADCNLACAYCFYLKKKALFPGSSLRMSEAVLERMISSYMATDQAVYGFGWQGGEPTLMGLDFFRKVTALQERFGRKGAVVSNGLQTNATLMTDELAEHFRKYNFLLGVSLDGPARIHDVFRRRIGGGPSHGEVMRGIAVLKRCGVEFNILTLVSSANAGHGRDVYRYLRDESFLYHQYIECVEFDAGGSILPFSVTGPQWGEFLCSVFDEWYAGDTRTVSVRLFDSVLDRMVNRRANVCHMADDCRQYLVVEHNGDVYPCDFFVEPHLKLGNVMRGEWGEFLESETYRRFGERKADRNAACRECPWLEWCAGDCVKNRPGRGSDPRSLSVLCEGWKMFYSHTHERFRALGDLIVRERAAAARKGMVQGAIPGRNDPCPCGSGRKFKKCCGRNLP